MLKLFKLSIGIFALLSGIAVLAVPSQNAQQTKQQSNLQAAKVTDAIASISLIEEKPVVVIPKGQTTEINAVKGMKLNVADTVRTKAKGRTQVDFNNGVSFRIGGNSALQIQPQNQLKLASGNMITWVKPGMKVPTEIVTPIATAAIRGTTAYVEYEETGGIKFFSWEGNVAVRLANQSEEVILHTGDEIIITAKDQVLPPVRRLTLAQWQTRLKTGKFLNSFTTPFPTRAIFEKLVPGQSQP